jgi:hypothetical protein
MSFIPLDYTYFPNTFFVILLVSQALVFSYCRYIPTVVKLIPADILLCGHTFYLSIIYVPKFLRNLLPQSSGLKMEAASPFEILKTDGFIFQMSVRSCTLHLSSTEIKLCLHYPIFIQEGVPCTLTVIVVSFMFFVPGRHVETHHCELSQPLMNVVVPVSCSACICLKLACNQQTCGVGVEAYAGISGHSLFVLCGT